MENYTIRFKDCGIYYQIHKNSTKPTIIMLHSFASSSLIFSSQILALKRVYQIITIDLPAHGKSLYSKYVDLGDMPEIIKLVMEKHNLNNAHFIGVSEGALVAQGFSFVYPKMVKSLVIVSSFSIFDNTYKAIQEAFFKSKVKLFFYNLFSFKKYKNFFVEKSAYNNEAKDKFLLSMQGFSRKSKHILKGLKRFYEIPKTAPNYSTYIVCGEHDLDVIKDASLLYEQKTPKTTLEGYNQAKQIVFLDNPRLFNERLFTFFKSIDEAN